MIELYDINIPIIKQNNRTDRKKEKAIIRQEKEEEAILSYDNEEYTEDYYDNIQYYYIKESCNNLMHICDE